MNFLPGQPFATIGPLEVFNLLIMVLFTLCFIYQIFFVFISLFKKPPRRTAKANHRYAVLICARDESLVIMDIIRSIRIQNYPTELIDIFVVADNCSDNTAEVAKNAGATVFERHNKDYIGKGYALEYGFESIKEAYGIDAYEAYFIFDADNVLDENYFREMNIAFDNGALACTSYRNAKNFGSNWITAGYGIWFLREARYLNQARYVLNTSCSVTGTGFYISSELAKNLGGWHYHLLSEDTEFSVDAVMHQKRISYAPDAVIYDEHPLKFKASWTQRLRWSRGTYQVFRRYGAKLFLQEFTNSKGHRFACYDLLMTLAPAMLLMAASISVNLTVLLCSLAGITSEALMTTALWSLALCFFYYACIMFVIGLVTTFTERKKIIGTPAQKIVSVLTFPFFMLTFVPIAVAALFNKPNWKPTRHCVSVDVEEFGHYLSGEFERP
ncbi:MAG: glycosyltransferase [Coriobacteriales bacterium]|jgi:cellulose synthase/poly-beta-1,6-N-acetylglucosamine synthase-like glycosyltransferase|nr:glycosyltransferase [Coriobacteriales bacterium]